MHEAGLLADATRCSSTSSTSRARRRCAPRSRCATCTRRSTCAARRRSTTSCSRMTWSRACGEGEPPDQDAQRCRGVLAGVLRGDIDWVASDHACCMESQKGDDVWPALPGFGGTALLYPVLLSEGATQARAPARADRRALSGAPARAFGCFPRKGTVAIGADADLALIDLEARAGRDARAAALGPGPHARSPVSRCGLAGAHHPAGTDRVPRRRGRRRSCGPLRLPAGRQPSRSDPHDDCILYGLHPWRGSWVTTNRPSTAVPAVAP